MNKAIVTGSSGLIGSEVCTYFCKLGWKVFGIDNNQRAVFFGAQGDTRWNQHRLIESLPTFAHCEIDTRNRRAMLQIMEDIRPDLVVNAAAQPSHDLAAKIPFEDFDINAVGTLNVLEATRRFAPAAPFVHLSTNKVYGDAPNEIRNGRAADTLGLRRPDIRHGHHRKLQDRSIEAFALWGIEARRRCNGAGIWPLFRPRIPAVFVADA